MVLSGTDRLGKAARIAERNDYATKSSSDVAAQEVAETTVQ